MDPTQNQSGTPGPIFSAGSTPEEPPMAPAPTGSSPRTPFSNGGGDIILQPEGDYYSGAAKTSSKKPLIIVGIVVAVAVIALLVMLPLFNNHANSNDTKLKKELYLDVSSIYSGYSNVIDSYDGAIGLDPANGIIAQKPENILFYNLESYNSIFQKNDYILEFLQDSKDIAKKLGKYESDIDFVASNIQASSESINKNSEIVAKLNEAFIRPIQNSENWQYVGCVSNAKTQELLSSSDKKLADIARKYNQLACKDDIQIIFSSGELRTPESVDDNTRNMLEDISNSLVSYLGSVDIKSKDETFNKLQAIMDDVRPEEETTTEEK